MAKEKVCYRCGKSPVHASWQICADRRIHRWICLKCDIALNKLVLKWVGDANWETKIERYTNRLMRG